MTPENGTFRSAFRAALDRSGTSVRSLARLLAGGDADARKVESERRKLHKYLSENDEARTVPERATAARLEGLLRLEAGSLADHPEVSAAANHARARRSLDSRLAALEARLDETIALTARGFEELGLRQHGLGGPEEDHGPRQ